MKFASALSLSLAMALCACGEQPKSKAAQLAGSGDLIALNCAAQPAALNLADPDLRYVPADQLRVLDGASTVTMCDVMRMNKRKLALFQFTSMKCFPCMKWIESVSSSLAAQGLSEDVAQVVVLTDALQTLSIDDAARLKNDVAKTAFWVHDFWGDMWAFFGTDGWQPGTEPKTKPLMVAMDVDAHGFYTEDTALDGPAAVALAEKVMGFKRTE